MRIDKSVNFSFDFFGFLTLLFITLKLCKVIDWSWWWVLAPAWIPLSLVALIVVIVVIVRRIRRKKWRKY